MEELPILFNGAMVRGILAGNKTNTRRIVKTDLSNLEWFEDEYGDWHHLIETCPVKKGDVLWVRETFSIAKNSITFRADYDKKKPT